MNPVTELYRLLFGKSHLGDGNVIDMAEHGRVGGVSTGQAFKYTQSMASEPSIVNSSGAILNAGDTFTGVGELNNYPDVLASVKTDQDGTLYCEFSPDGTNWDSSTSFNVNAGINEVHRLVKGSRYFRARFTNTSVSNQTYFRLSISYGIFSQLTSGIGTPIQQDADAATVRAVTEEAAIALGLFTGYSIVNKFGTNGTIDTGSTPEDIWENGGTYSGFSTSAQTLAVSSSSVNDTSAGTGARTIRITGLDADYNVLQETVTLNGTSTVTTSGSFLRAHTATTLTAGSNGVNAGDITIKQSTSNNVMLFMLAGRNQTNCSAYTVPAGYTAYMRKIHASIRSNTSASVSGYIWLRPYQGVFRSRRPFGFSNNSPLQDSIYGGLVFTEKSDLVLRIDTVSANNTSVTGGYDLVLIKN